MNKLKIAIHHDEKSFSKAWIDYCNRNNIDYKLVNAYSNDIINKVGDCDIFMWHWHHNDYKAQLFARQLLYSLELKGLKVFPNFHTAWFFDDKIGQKYLLESIDAPFVKTYIFYEKELALNFLRNYSYPIVAKLKNGAGSSNVKLIKNYKEGKKYIKKAFTKGFSYYRWSNFQDKIKFFQEKKTLKNFLNIFKGFIRGIIPNHVFLNLPIERNYVYFQEFIPDNSYDIRIIVIGNKAFGIKRFVRKNDFRASGSGKISYDPKEIPTECVQIAFEINKKIKSQCTSFDFILKKNKPLIVEISYGFAQEVYRKCPGYWDEKIYWHKNNSNEFIPEYFIIEDIIYG